MTLDRTGEPCTSKLSIYNLSLSTILTDNTTNTHEVIVNKEKQTIDIKPV